MIFVSPWEWSAQDHKTFWSVRSVLDLTCAIIGISVTTSPNDRERFVRSRKWPNGRKSIDTLNMYPGKALGLPVSTLKSVDTRKSFPCKAVTTCRHFWGYLVMRASFAPRKTTK
jgi:hypothetical protein